MLDSLDANNYFWIAVNDLVIAIKESLVAAGDRGGMQDVCLVLGMSWFGVSIPVLTISITTQQL